MEPKGKSRLDNREETEADRAKRFADIERREGGEIGRKEMAMHRRQREETPQRTERFVDIERGKEE